MCIDIVKIWFGIASVQILSICDRVICSRHDNDLVLLFHVFILAWLSRKFSFFCLFCCSWDKLFPCWFNNSRQHINPCHAELIKMPYPLLTVSESDCLIQIVDKKLYTAWQIVQIQISWLLKSQLIRIYTVYKSQAYPGSAEQGLILKCQAKLLQRICLFFFFIIFQKK